jgi:deoxyadenosine/deoxycytidine kinase
MQKVHISIEGNIGVGKSTLLSKIYNHFNKNGKVSCAWEPLDEWDNNGFLGDMYSKRIEHAEFQYMVISSMFHKSFMGLSNSEILIQERSMDSAFEVFTKNNVQNTRSVDMLKYSYDKLKELLEETFSSRKVRIYLRVPPFVAFARVCQRSRSSELNMSEEYITAINNSYEEWLGLSSNTSNTDEIIKIDASRSIEDVTQDVLRIISSIVQPNGLEPQKLF